MVQLLRLKWIQQRALVIALIFVLPACLSGAPLLAKWIAPTDGDWDNPANWDIGQVPNNSATETYAVVWDAHPVTIRVRSDVTVDSLRLAVGGVLELSEVEFNVRDRLEWTDGTVDGKWSPGSLGSTSRLVAHGYALLRGRTPESLTLRGICELAIRDLCNLESHLLCDGPVRVLVEPTASLHARPGAGLFQSDESPEIQNDGLIQIHSDTTSFQCLPILNFGRIVVEERIVDFLSLEATAAIELREGSLHLEGASLHGLVILSGGQLSGVGFIQWAEVDDPMSGRLRFNELLMNEFTETTFVVGRPYDFISVQADLTLAGALEVKLAPGFVPKPDDIFEIVRADGGIDGQFHDFDFNPILFGRRLEISGGSFLVDLTPDSKRVVLHHFLPTAIGLGDSRLLFRFPQPPHGEIGGCFAVPYAAINLPPGNWAGGRLEVEISTGYNATVDRLTFRRNLDFPDSASLRLQEHPEGGWDVTFREVGIGRARIEGARMTCSLSGEANHEAIVALLGWLHYDNNEVMPTWFKKATDIYPQRIIRTRFADASGTQTEVLREVSFPYIGSISLGPPRQVSNRTKERIAVVAEFSDRTRVEMPHLESVWRHNCPSYTATESPAVVFAGDDEGVYFCCYVEVTCGPFTVQQFVYDNDQDDSQCTLVSIYNIPPCASLPPSTSLGRQGQQDAQSGLSLATFYTLQSLMRETSQGRRLIDLYWRHTAEVSQILLANPALRDQVKQGLIGFQPGVRALLAGRAQDFVISQEMVNSLNAVWDSLVGLASPELRERLVQEQGRYGRFQAFVNHDFSRWADLLSLPTPTEPWVHVSGATREGNQFRVEINEVPGIEFGLWRSPDLETWQPVPDVEVIRDGFTFQFTDPSPPAQGAFYDVRPPSRQSEIPPSSRR